MTKLEYTFKNDTLFKMLFVKYPDLLKRLVAALLGIQVDSIEKFEITNPEMPPEGIGDKFCRLDINMTVDKRRVDLEIQVKDDNDFAERSLFYWAREYSTALGEGGVYTDLPRVIIISIVNFIMFDCVEFHSEYQALEVSRHTSLTDRMSLIYFELPKLPKSVNIHDGLQLWLKLFDAETEEELKQIEILEAPDMQQAIEAYRSITATEEFRTLERMRSDARHNEASALNNARREGAAEERLKWENVVADKEARNEKQTAHIAEQTAYIAEQTAYIAKLEALIKKNN